MGAAAGHIKHLYEDNDLYILDLVNIVRLFSSRKINGKVEEKIDGMNLFVSVIDGKIALARNKGHLKDYGKNSIGGIEDIEKFFCQYPNIVDVLKLLYNDLSLLFLSDFQIVKMFNNGERWINVDVCDNKIENVIQYSYPFISIHNFNEVDRNGNMVATYSYRMVDKLLLKLPNIEQERYFKFIGKHIVKVSYRTVSNQEKEMIDKLDNLNIDYNWTIGETKVEWWIKHISTKFQISDRYLLELIAKRFVYDDKMVNLNGLKKLVNENAELIDYIRSGYKDDRNLIHEQIKEIIVEFENIVLQATTEYINYNEFSMNDMCQRLHTKESVYNIIDNIRLYGTYEDKKVVDANRHLLDKLGLSKFKSLEGVIFYYSPLKVGKNKQAYKLTGVFSPLNQILWFKNKKKQIRN